MGSSVIEIKSSTLVYQFYICTVKAVNDVGTSGGRDGGEERDEGHPAVLRRVLHLYQGYLIISILSMLQRIQKSLGLKMLESILYKSAKSVSIIPDP